MMRCRVMRVFWKILVLLRSAEDPPFASLGLPHTGCPV